MWSTDLLAFWTVLKRLNTKVDDLDLENFPFFQVAAIDVKKKKQKLVKVGNFSLYYHSFKSSSFEGFDECAWAIFKKYLKGKEKIFYWTIKHSKSNKFAVKEHHAQNNLAKNQDRGNRKTLN